MNDEPIEGISQAHRFSFYLVFCGRLCWLALSYRISYRVVSHKLTATSDFLMHLSAMPYRPNGLQSKSLVGRQVLTWDTALRCMFVSVGLL